MAKKTKSGFDEGRLALVLLDYELILKAGAWQGKDDLDRMAKEAKKAIEDTTVPATKAAAEKVLAMAEAAQG